MQDDTPSSGDAKIPGTYKKFAAKFPDAARAHQQLSNSAFEAGPLDTKTLCLIKVGLCVGAGLESALRSHVRRATAAGCTQAEIEHAILQGLTTLGFPTTVKAWSWAQVQFERDRLEVTE
jgi:alkylhydroperoxidase/carboxymuconolactone decarboxylase family protein YurZ